MYVLFLCMLIKLSNNNSTCVVWAFKKDFGKTLLLKNKYSPLEIVSSHCGLYSARSPMFGVDAHTKEQIRFSSDFT